MRCINIGRENRWKKLRAGRKERILKQKNKNSGSLENNIMNEYYNNWDFKLTEEIVMSLVSKKVDVPLISTSSEISMRHIDNRSISIADWIGFKRIFWRRLSPRSPPSASISSQSSSIRSRSSSRTTPQLVTRSLYDRLAKTDNTIVILKELLAWKSMSDEFLSQEVDIIFGFKYWDDVMHGQINE